MNGQYERRNANTGWRSVHPRVRLLIGAAGLGVALTGCTSGSGSSAAVGSSSTSSAASTSSTAPHSTTTTEVGLSASGSLSFDDEQGYNFMLTYSVRFGAPLIDDTKDPPNESTILVPTSGTASISNKTPGRLGPQESPYSFLVYGLFKRSRSVCNALGQVISIASPSPGGYCVLPYAMSVNGLNVSGMASGSSAQDAFRGRQLNSELGNYPLQDAAFDTDSSTETVVMTDLTAGPDLGQLLTATGAGVAWQMQRQEAASSVGHLSRLS